MAVVRYVGASGSATIPMAGPAPKARTPGGDGATPGEAARPGRGANPQPCRSPTTVTEPGPVTRWHTFRGDRCHDRTKMAPVAATCRHCHVTLDPKQARDHPSSYSLACARCTIAWARRTYLLSARSRTVLTPSVFCRASASLLDRPRPSVARRPAQRTSAAPTRRPRAEWSRTCRPRLAGGGWGSALPVPARAGAWRRATARRRDRGRGW
jgi:hypothetical protein